MEPVTVRYYANHKAEQPMLYYGVLGCVNSHEYYALVYNRAGTTVRLFDAERSRLTGYRSSLDESGMWQEVFAMDVVMNLYGFGYETAEGVLFQPYQTEDFNHALPRDLIWKDKE